MFFKNACYAVTLLQKKYTKNTRVFKIHSKWFNLCIICTRVF